MHTTWVLVGRFLEEEEEVEHQKNNNNACAFNIYVWACAIIYPYIASPKNRQRPRQQQQHSEFMFACSPSLSHSDSFSLFRCLSLSFISSVLLRCESYQQNPHNRTFWNALLFSTCWYDLYLIFFYKDLPQLGLLCLENHWEFKNLVI